VMLKPETVSRRLIGEVLRRIEGEGFRISALKLGIVTEPQATRLYEAHVGKHFYQELVNHVTSGPVVFMVAEAEDAIKRMMRLIGATDPADAEVGTIRRDYGLSATANAIHAADNAQNVAKEIGIFFNEGEIVKY